MMDFSDISGSTTFVQKQKDPCRKSNDCDEFEDFYFESDNLALRGNTDYLKLLRTMAILEAQKIKAAKDIDKLVKIKLQALRDPVEFAEKLQNGEDLGIPSRINVAELPDIDWSKYNVPLPSNPVRPTTRGKTLPAELSESIRSNRKSREERERLGKVLVRGRVFDQSKPETFNQLWTAEEQRRLEELLVDYPPEEIEMRRWEKIANALGNRTPIQVQSRVQKFFLKLQRAGLPIPGRLPTVPPSAIRKRSHQHQRNNHFLHRPSTFFPSSDPPVFMDDMDEDSYQDMSSVTIKQEPEVSLLDTIKHEQDCETMDDVQPDIDASAGQLREMWAKIIDDEVQRCSIAPSLIHEGFKCDFCTAEPLVGTRWHCLDCEPFSSKDFCNTCVAALPVVDNHVIWHKLRPIRTVQQRHLKPSTSVGDVWDEDYLANNFTQGFSYLDPNFLPAELGDHT